jgi:Mannosyltransferase (PIG-V)
VTRAREHHEEHEETGSEKEYSPTHVAPLSPLHFLTPSLRRIWLPFLLSRGWIALFVYLSHSRHPYLAEVPGGWKGVANWWLNPWTTYDSQWFLSIAQHGYSTAQTTAFFPLYPFLLRLAGPHEVAMAAWGVLVSNAAFAGSLLLLHRLTTFDFDERIAIRAVWLLAFFPSTTVFSAVYTESVFLLLIVGSFLCARQGRWGGAGALALLAALTRNSGPVIFVALLFEYSRSLGHRPQRIKMPALAAVSLPLWGFVAAQACFALRHGLTSGVQSQQAFHRAFTWPWTPILWDIADVIMLRAVGTATLVNLAATLLALYFVFRYWKQPSASYSILLLFILLMQLSYAHIIPPYTVATIRYMSATFPFVQRLSLWLEKIFQNSLRLALATAIYLLLNALMSYQFGMKSYLY